MTVDSFNYVNSASAAILKAMITRAPQDLLPWTPLHRALAETTPSLVSTAGISLVGDRPFDAEASA